MSRLTLGACFSLGLLPLPVRLKKKNDNKKYTFLVLDVFLKRRLFFYLLGLLD